jgi:hypothetical protein
MRTVHICVFKVKYDGREISCDYSKKLGKAVQRWRIGASRFE